MRHRICEIECYLTDPKVLREGPCNMKLFREMGLLTATFLVIGNIVGIGIFTTSGLIADQLGPSFWLLGVWVVGGLLAFIGALCYSILGARIPRAGGEYAFLYPHFGPFAAFLSGWASLLIGFSAPIAAASLGFAYYLRPFLPSGFLEFPWALRVVAASTVLAVTLILSGGLRIGGRFHSLVTILNLALILGFAGLVLGRAPVDANLSPLLAGGTWIPDWGPLASSVLLVMFTYSGWNAAAYVAEEIRSPERNLPRALLAGTLLVVALYLLVNLAYYGAAPLELLRGEIPVAELAASAVLGASGGNMVGLLILASILSSLTAMSIAGPRVYFAMSRDHLFPLWLSAIAPRRKLPLAAIWFQCAVALVLISVGTFYQILLYSGSVLVLFSTLTVAVLFKMRAEGSQGLRHWLYFRILPAFFVLVNAGILVNAALAHTREFLAGLITVSLGIPVYLYYRRRSLGDETAPRAPAEPQA